MPTSSYFRKSIYFFNLTMTLKCFYSLGQIDRMNLNLKRLYFGFNNLKRNRNNPTHPASNLTQLWRVSPPLKEEIRNIFGCFNDFITFIITTKIYFWFFDCFLRLSPHLPWSVSMDTAHEMNHTFICHHTKTWIGHQEWLLNPFVSHITYC